MLKDGGKARFYLATLVYGAFDPHVPRHGGVGIASD